MKFLFVIGFCTALFSQELHSLLDAYKKESDLSKVTKRDTSGFLEIYTREDLERMQAHNLLDVLKTVPGLYLKRGANNLTLFTTASAQSTPVTFSRIYINDHDMTSSSFGSGFLIWGEMSIEYIDHIEIYKATSSMEFGNENASIIVKLYTKDAARDNGSKVRIIGDSRGGYDANIYTTDITKNGISYFAYANSDNIRRKTYHNTYNNKTYDFKSDKKGYNLYGSLGYKDYKLEFGKYYKKNDSFIGIGTHKTPEGGGLDAQQLYIHLTKKFPKRLKLQISYDNLEYNRQYNDENGIRIANAPLINSYNIKFNDDIFSVILEKKFQNDANTLFIGSFYKYKAFTAKGDYYDTALTYRHQNQLSNSLNLVSLYAEDTYAVNDTTHILASVKGDFFRYQKDVKSQNEYLAKIGFVKAAGRARFKFSYSKTYIPLAFYQLYNPQNIPYRANPQLNAPKMDLFTTGVYYQDHSKKHKFSLEFVHATLKDTLVYDPSTVYGWVNSKEDIYKELLEMGYRYKFDLDNKIVCNIDFGRNSKDTNFSPAFETTIRAYNRYKKFDFYNELIYRSSYTLYNIYTKASLDFTSAVKYNYSNDFSVGLRGENILNRGFALPYRGVSYAIPVTDQKFFLNMEYTF
ncbi:TonB-dependent receptor plug domain-containing protein [Sulfurimonas sp. NW9]|uniref:TonB-dependent receptor plug domain-containing protein n=1 Tax=Sulfurimonas sp. NW9 TaxID=2922728 RepID=UPI003DA8728C